MELLHRRHGFSGRVGDGGGWERLVLDGVSRKPKNNEPDTIRAVEYTASTLKRQCMRLSKLPATGCIPANYSEACYFYHDMILYALQDINFNLTGYLWLVGNSAAAIINTFWNKVYITHYTYTKELKIQTSYGVSFIQQVETLPIVFFLAIMNNEGAALQAYTPLPGITKLMVLMTCASSATLACAQRKVC